MGRIRHCQRVRYHTALALVYTRLTNSCKLTTDNAKVGMVQIMESKPECSHSVSKHQCWVMALLTHVERSL